MVETDAVFNGGEPEFNQNFRLVVGDRNYNVVMEVLNMEMDDVIAELRLCLFP